MTTAAAAERYLAQHLAEWLGRGYAVYNPHDKPLDELPVIYGFNNGGSNECYIAVLLAEDGEFLGSHMCSQELYMPSDLGVREGSRPDRHEHFRAHYPDGYRMDFVSHADVLAHLGLSDAIRKNGEKREAEEAAA